MTKPTKRPGGAKWRKRRRHFLDKHPLCEFCLDEGRTVPAEHVHHRVPLHLGGDGWASENLCSLCRPCHEELHAPKKTRTCEHGLSLDSGEWQCRICAENQNGGL